MQRKTCATLKLSTTAGAERQATQSVTDQTIPAPSDLETQLQQALRYWHDVNSEKGLLSAFVLFRHEQRMGAATPRQTTNQLLRTALDHLRHSAPLEADLLELRFLDGWPVDRVANRLNYAESTVLRRQREAISQLAAIFRRMEDDSRRARSASIDARIDAPAYTELVGVAEQITTLAEVVGQPAPPWILSLEGIGGIGKTVLADALMRQMGDGLTFDDFAWVSAQPAILDLHGAIRAKDRPALTSPALVTALLQQLMPDEATGILSRPDQALALLKRRLKQAPHLVVIDNLETVADYGGVAADASHAEQPIEISAHHAQTAGRRTQHLSLSRAGAVPRPRMHPCAPGRGSHQRRGAGCRDRC
jgi:hypothetical protein